MRIWQGAGRSLLPRRLLLRGAVLPFAALLIGAAEVAPVGYWLNSDRSVVVRIQPCGAETWCAVVERASAAAKADAARSGTARLVGTVVMRDMVQTAQGRWRAKLFVPDENLHASGVLRRLSNSHIEVRGCVMLVVCKREVWTRISTPSI